MTIESVILSAEMVIERTPTANEKVGPGEYGKVGFKINERVFWLDSYYFPGTDHARHKHALDMASEIARAINEYISQRRPKP